MLRVVTIVVTLYSLSTCSNHGIVCVCISVCMYGCVGGCMLMVRESELYFPLQVHHAGPVKLQLHSKGIPLNF